MKRFFTLNLFRQFHRKDRDLTKLRLLLFSILFFAAVPKVQAQCSPVCNGNYGMNSNNDAATIEYDNIIAGINNCIIKESDGTFKVFGSRMADNIEHALSPLVVNSTNFPGIQGTALKVASGGSNAYADVSQAVVLTTTGLYGWGVPGYLVYNSIQSSTASGPLTIEGSNAYKLPPGVEPSNVKSLFGAYATLGLLTCDGQVWILTQLPVAAGAGLSAYNNVWNRVTTTAPGNPTLDHVVALRGSDFGFMALCADGSLWTWGYSTYLGDGTAVANRSRAEKMTLPNASGTIKMIGMSSFSYYVLYTDGNLYALGNNESRQLGDWTTTERTAWVQPRYTSGGQVMNNIHWISPSENNGGGTPGEYSSINVLTNTGQLFNWGANYRSALRGNGINWESVNPGSPTADRMLAVESGYAGTYVIKQCSQNFGFAGNSANGSMGNGSSGGIIAPYSYNTAPVNICGANAISTAGAPVFNAGLPTARCSGAGTVTYTATTSGSGGITYSLSPAAAGTITSTGTVTYNAGWSGTVVITATANGGCGTPETATHTVTVAPTPGVPVFTGLPTVRCSGAGTVTYAATSSNADSITYSISNTGTGTQPTINPATGEVTYPANWSGNSTITATATGCSTTTSSTYSVNTNAVQAIADAATGPAATPLLINVLANDLCNPDINTVSIITPPTNGIVQIGAGGVVTYLPNGNFSGTDTFVYQVCKGGACSQATVTVNITEKFDDVCITASLPKTYYLPFPENADLKKSLIHAGSVNSNNTTNARRIISIRANYTGTIIYYDHWEDGYEPTAGSRTQTSTEVWGDGNTANGVAPGYPTDVFPEGAILTIDQNNPYRTSDGLTSTITPIYYDGRDKIYSTKLLTLTKVTGSDATFEVQSTKGNVIDVSKFGRLFVVPFGEDISTLANPTITTSSFRYTSLFVRAAENGTIVQLDYNHDGVVDVTSPTLSEGMVWFYEGQAPASPTSVGNTTNDTNKAIDIKSGAILTSNKPVGVDLVFGGIDNYGTRNIPLLPGDYYGSTYYSPVHTTNTVAPVYAVFSNILAEPITINWKNGLGDSGSIIIPAKGYTSLHMDKASAYKFQSANGKSYTAVTIIDADSSGLDYD